MSQNTGTLITAPIRPNDSFDLIASAFQNEIKGGIHSYADISERDALFVERRQSGMIVYIENSDEYYKLESGLTNSDWTLINLEGSGDFLATSGGTIAGNLEIALDLSATTIYSGGTDLYDIFLTESDLTATTISAGTNIFISQSGSNYQISTVESPFFANLSATTISSGSTDLYDIFLTDSDNTNFSNSNLSLDDNRFHDTAGFNLTFSGTGLFGFGTSTPTEKITIDSGNIQLDENFGLIIGSNIIDGGSGFFGDVNYLQMRTASDYSEPWILLNASGNTMFGRFAQVSLGANTSDIGMTIMKPSSNLTLSGSNQIAFYDNSGLYSINNSFVSKDVVGFISAEGSSSAGIRGSVAIGISAVTMTEDYTLYTNNIDGRKITLSANNEAPLNLPIIPDSFSSTTHGDVWISTGITGAVLNVVVGGITKRVELT